MCRAQTISRTQHLHSLFKSVSGWKCAISLAQLFCYTYLHHIANNVRASISARNVSATRSLPSLVMWLGAGMLLGHQHHLPGMLILGYGKWVGVLDNQLGSVHFHKFPEYHNGGHSELGVVVESNSNLAVPIQLTVWKAHSKFTLHSGSAHVHVA